MTQGFYLTYEPEDLSVFCGQCLKLEADDLAHPVNCMCLVHVAEKFTGTPRTNVVLGSKNLRTPKFDLVICGLASIS